LSNEHRAKLAAAKRGKPLSPEHRAKLSAIRRGRKLSAEHREKLAATKRGSLNPAWKGTPAERFASFVGDQDANGCIPWLGPTQRGYGVVSRGKPDGRSIPAHRFAWLQAVGPIPEGRQLHHVCENKICVNVAHLQPMTVEEHAAHHKPLEASRRQILAERR
jgi:hypothetical protein